ncbi:hypothetical protein J3A83DRAFT_4370241 [Scleroderma citrinum]
MQRSIRHLRITPKPRKTTFHFTARRSLSVAFPTDTPGGVHDSSSPPSSSLAGIANAFRERRLNALLNSLSQETSDSSDVWACYVDFTHNLSHSDLPLEIHQRVLRRCVPHPSVLRPLSAGRMRGDTPPRPPHIYEARLKTVIQNIRLAGGKPALEDYHFIMEQFAAVGHYTGAIQVYNELKHVHNLKPAHRTFTLCLQSIAHRLSLPMYKLQRARNVSDAMTSCRKLLDDFKGLNMPLTSVFLDLTMRILKETADEGVFLRLMKMGYGIDLDYPDHPESSTAAIQTHPVLPFSTPALNTTLDMIGRVGDISKLVQTFEVLTQPLPPQASQHYSLEFDDDDDFGVVNPASTQPHQCPCALPNTTTYNILLKHVSRAGHSSLARHYLLQAFKLDRQADRSHRRQVYYTPDVTPPVPFAINRGMILSVFGLANRTRDMELMRFVGVITRRTYRRKTNDINYYSQLHEQRLASILPQDDSQSPSPPPDSLSVDIFSTDPQLPPLPNSTTKNSETGTASNPLPSLKRCFNISTHLQVLRKDLHEISTFYEQEFLPAHTRISQRVKERLGRRVWNEKDIYLRTTNNRTMVTREEWSGMVNYKRNVVVKNVPHFEPRDNRGARRGKKSSGSRGVATTSTLGHSPFVPPVRFFDPSFYGAQARHQLNLAGKPRDDVQGKSRAVDTTPESREQ